MIPLDKDEKGGGKKDKKEKDKKDKGKKEKKDTKKVIFFVIKQIVHQRFRRKNKFKIHLAYLISSLFRLFSC